MPTGRGVGIRYVPELDGLRGAAVGAVLLFHGGHLRGGYLGVDLFFVLSGYLITSLLLAESTSKGRIALGAFWSRRARRLLPALGLMLLGVALYAQFVAQPADLGQIRLDGLATLGYVANWRFVLEHFSYWSLFTAPSPLQHTWSLAIEEQFYFVWPLVIAFLLWRESRRPEPKPLARRIVVLSLVFAAVSEVMAILLYRIQGSNRVYFGTDTRAVAILLGAALAATMSRRGPARTRRGRIAVEVCRSGRGPGPGIGVAATRWNLTPPVRRRPVRLLTGSGCGGRVCHPSDKGTRGDGIRDPAVDAPWHHQLRRLPLALADLHLVEQRHRIARLGPVRSPDRSDAGSFDRLIPCCRAAHQTRRTPCITSSHHRSRWGGDPGCGAARSDDGIPTSLSHYARQRLPARCAAGGARPTTASGRRQFGALRLAREGFERLNTRPSLLILNGALPDCSFPAGASGYRAGAGVVIPIAADCSTHWTSEVNAFRPNVVLFTIGDILGDLRHNGRWVQPCTPAFDRWFASSLHDAAVLFTQYGAHLVIATSAYSDYAFAPTNLWPQTDCLNNIELAAAAWPNTSVAALGRYICPSLSQCRETIDGVPLRPDGVHYRNRAAQAVAAWLLPWLGLHTADGTPVTLVSSH